MCPPRFFSLPSGGERLLGPSEPFRDRAQFLPGGAGELSLPWGWYDVTIPPREGRRARPKSDGEFRWLCSYKHCKPKGASRGDGDRVSQPMSRAAPPVPPSPPPSREKVALALSSPACTTTTACSLIAKEVMVCRFRCRGSSSRSERFANTAVKRRWWVEERERPSSRLGGKGP